MVTNILELKVDFINDKMTYRSTINNSFIIFGNIALLNIITQSS